MHRLVCRYYMIAFKQNGFTQGYHFLRWINAFILPDRANSGIRLLGAHIVERELRD